MSEMHGQEQAPKVDRPLRSDGVVPHAGDGEPVVIPKIQRVIKIPVYTVIVAVALTVGSPIASFYAATAIAKRNSEQLIVRQQQAKQEATAEARRITCAFFGSSLDVYRENPPISDAGRAQQRNYADLYRISGCQPPRTK